MAYLTEKYKPEFGPNVVGKMATLNDPFSENAIWSIITKHDPLKKQVMMCQGWADYSKVTAVIEFGFKPLTIKVDDGQYMTFIHVPKKGCGKEAVLWFPHKSGELDNMLQGIRHAQNVTNFF